MEGPRPGLAQGIGIPGQEVGLGQRQAQVEGDDQLACLEFRPDEGELPENESLAGQGRVDRAAGQAVGQVAGGGWAPISRPHSAQPGLAPNRGSQAMCSRGKRRMSSGPDRHCPSINEGAQTGTM